jgi:SPP1 family predicted phage head-tail adaptor
MLSNRLRHRIAFQQPVKAQHETTGAETITWQTAESNGVQLVSVPAEVLTGAGRELNAAGTQQAETAARINLRWFPGLLPTWRVLWDGNIYNITGTSTDITGRREWRLVCSGGLSDGR